MNIHPKFDLACLGLSVLVLLTGCEGRPRFSSDPSALEGAVLGAQGGDDRYIARLNLGAGAQEASDAGGLLPLPAHRTYTGLVRTLERLRDDADAAGVLLTLEQQSYNWAQTEEIGRLLFALRQKKKSVVCHAHSLHNQTIWLALRACDKIWLSAAGEVNTVGIAAQLTYLKTALDRLNIQAELMSVGRYKSGAEPLTRDGPSENSRENLLNMLVSIRTSWHEGVATSRKQAKLSRRLEDGPYTPREAKEFGLVDAVGFETAALSDLKKLAKAERVEVRFGRGASPHGDGWSELARLLSGADGRSEGRPHLTVVPAVGAITMSSGSPFGSQGITADGLVELLRRLKDDEATKAVVLRLDSPGGSPLASDLIWHEVRRLREKKPVIVSVGAMAASGGYYIASAADKIVAERTSIVGSIGVFGGKVVIGSALEDLGISTHTLTARQEQGAAERAAYLSPLLAWDESTRARVRTHMQDVYNLFLHRVSKGRRMELARVKKSAEGAVFTGSQAKARGLVDEIGGLSHALGMARKRAGLASDVPVLVEGRAGSMLESLFGAEQPSVSLKSRLLALFDGEPRVKQGLQISAGLERFLASVMPLAQGESSVLALPWALEID